MPRKYRLRTETHVVATRMDAYKCRERFEPIIARKTKPDGYRSLPIAAMAIAIKPRVVAVEIIHRQADLDLPVERADIFVVLHP
ncbi:MAG: hypothetical protein PUP93_30375 [Rhizonema sp. NSF051]|nr:hypothetical protein [Rhizonema sp. NSF051]